MLVVISEDYLNDLVTFGKNLTFPVQYYGKIDLLIEKFPFMSTEVMGYVIIQDIIKSSDLEKLLKLCKLQHSEIYTPRVLLCTTELERVRAVVSKAEYKDIEISGLEYELLSTEDIKRLVGTLYLENFDVFQGKRILYETIKHSYLPSLDARYILTGVVRQIFSNISRSRNLEELLEIDEPYNKLKKLNPTLAILREMLLYKYFNQVSPNVELFQKQILDFDPVIRIEYSLIKRMIEEDLDVEIYREIRKRFHTISENSS